MPLALAPFFEIELAWLLEWTVRIFGVIGSLAFMAFLIRGLVRWKRRSGL